MAFPKGSCLSQRQRHSHSRNTQMHNIRSRHDLPPKASNDYANWGTCAHHMTLMMHVGRVARQHLSTNSILQKHY
jgi:hypothetical protein